VAKIKSSEAALFDRINLDLLAQMMRANVTVAQVVGAIQSVSSLHEYNTIVGKRVRGPLGISESLKALATALTDEECEAARQAHRPSGPGKSQDTTSGRSNQSGQTRPANPFALSSGDVLS